MKNKLFIDESKSKVFLNGEEIEGVHSIEIKIKYTPEERIPIKTDIIEIEFKDLEVLGKSQGDE
ncbi:hypothetical protein VSU16_04605 [Cetobacterium somerae]|uniref:hypothetical protein n=1 Tax=Cetobacterium somerae TaxID=188913 RepID=UPI002E7BA427|nr:hypothetical protein [Cetobacterium somerae]WVJ02024.1 hypothetical protein VSU16_04605 [Cetobacterium somerae]